MTRPLILSTVCLYALASWGNDDETHFKPKAYAPGQTLRDRTFSESVYVPSVSNRSIGKRVEAPGAASRWRFFKREKTLDEAKKLADVSVEHGTDYKQEKQISVPTIKADQRDVTDKKPFVESDIKLPDDTFKPKEVSREKNPLLAPRQGIKAPE